MPALESYVRQEVTKHAFPVITGGMYIPDGVPEQQFGHFLIHIHDILPASAKGLKQKIPHAYIANWSRGFLKAVM